MQVTWKRLGTRMLKHPSTPPVNPKSPPHNIAQFYGAPLPGFARLCNSRISSIKMSVKFWQKLQCKNYAKGERKYTWCNRQKWSLLMSHRISW